MIQTDCPQCDTPLKAPDEYKGKSPRCPKCRTRVPAGRQAATATARPAPSSDAIARPKAPASPPPPPPAKPKSAEDSLLDELLAEVDQKPKPKPRPRVRKTAAAGRPRAKAGAAPGAAKPNPVLTPKPRKSMMPTLIMVGVSAFVVLVVGAYMWTIVRDRRATADAVRLLDDLDGELSGLGGTIDQGAERLKKKEYAEAKRVLQGARRTATSIKSRLDEAVLAVSTDAARDRLQGALTKVKGSVSRIDSLLKSDDLVYGSRGLILFDGKWISPDKKDELYIEKMKQLGRAYRQDFKKWMTTEEYNKAKGLVLYQNQWMTKAQKARILADAVAKRRRIDEDQRKAALRLKREQEKRLKREEAIERKIAEQKAARDGKYPPTAPRWVLDNFEDGKTLWKAQGWGNPATVTVAPHRGSKRMQISVERGLKDKAAIGRPIDLELSTRDMIALDIAVVSKGVVKVALAIQSDAWYESRMKTARVGEGRVEFSLQSGDFKCAKTNWRHTTKAKNLDAVRDIYLLFYTKRAGTYHVDNIVAERAR